MAFIVTKKINGKDYFYLQESKREGDKVKSVSLGYLGKTRDEAEKRMEEILGNRETKSESVPPLRKPSQKDAEVLIQNQLKLIHKEISIEELSNFCKRKGFVFRSSDIYGGFAGFWDFGSLGVELFNNIKKEWWDYFVRGKDNIVGMEASAISHPRVWKASGHLDNFNDVFVKCKKCGKTNKIDESEINNPATRCDKENCKGEYEVVGKFNLMFSTDVGVGEKENVIKAYLRGETAQGMFADFKLIKETSRQQLPFGIAQIGRCFRNEIAPRDFLFRSREFHIGEFEFFINPKEMKCDLLSKEHLNLKFKFLDEEMQKKGSDELKESTIKEILELKKLDEWHAYWLAEQILWFKKIGLNNIKIREHTKDELSHYSSATFDIDYEYPFGSKEVAGIANRGQYDLLQHQKESKEKMEIHDDKTNEKVIPRVIEPTFGMERIFLGVLVNSYYVDNEKGNVILKLPPRLAPIKAAIFPLVKGEKLEKISGEIVKELKKDFNVVYDKSGSIGRRYARNDEIGTPYCITIDEDSLKNKDVTIRDRDSTKQIRVLVKDLRRILGELIREEIEFEKAGKKIDTRKK